MDLAAIRHSLLPGGRPGLPLPDARRGVDVPKPGAPLSLREVPGADPREAGEKVESLFATMLVKELRKALPEEGFFGSGPGADVFNGWLDEFMGEQLARDGSLDLAGRVTAALEEREGDER